MQVAAASIAAVADRADRLARVDAVARAERRGLVEVHVGVVDVGAVAVDHEVVARCGVVLLELHAAAAGGHHAGPAAGEEVVALVRVAGAARPEPRTGAAELVATADGEDVVVEIEGVALDVPRLRA